MDDNSTKSLMVDERQLARDVLDNLFEKTHCDCNVDWCLYEIYPELQIGKSLPHIWLYSQSMAFVLFWALSVLYICFKISRSDMSLPSSEMSGCFIISLWQTLGW